MNQGEELLAELRGYYLEKKPPIVRLFWDSPLTKEDVESVQKKPRLSWLLAWKGEIFDEEGEESVLPRPLLMAVTWGQDKSLVTRLARILDRQGVELKKLLSRERRTDPDFYKWIKSSKTTRRLLS